MGSNAPAKAFTPGARSSTGQGEPSSISGFYPQLETAIWRWHPLSRCVNRGPHGGDSASQVDTLLDDRLGAMPQQQQQQQQQQRIDLGFMRLLTDRHHDRLLAMTNGRSEAIHCDKISKRIRALCYGLQDEFIDVDAVVQRVFTGLYPGVTTIELDNLAAEICATMITKHHEYGTLAARLAVSNLHKETNSSFSGVMEDLYNHINKRTKKHSPLISEEVINIIRNNAERLDGAIDYQRDYNYSFFGFKDDSIEGIYETLKQCAVISKRAGGIGLNVHNIRSLGAYVAGTNGTSNGLVPMLRVYNNTARYVDQGGNKRPGAFAIYLEPWHPDILQFVELRKNTGAEEIRARDLFYALWIPDLFMKRVEMNGQWTLMDPHECPGLADCWGEEFEKLYCQYEKDGRGRKSIPAQEVWYAIIEAQIETGTPFMVYKDACNRKSNHQHLGTIKCSNLCTEIVEYSSPDETAVCNLASIALGRFVNPKDRTFDFERLQKVTHVITRNLNKIIDRNYYPVIEARRSNMRHRPIGIGVQGLADALLQLRYAFDSEEASALNKRIFETIYYAALEASCELAETDGTYETYEGSPVSRGILQPDMWGVDTEKLTSGLDWAGLRQKIKKFGLRNSLLLSPMPTASTAQILGNNESFEPFTSNVYTRRVLSGEFQIVNPFLLTDLTKLGLWSDDLKAAIVANQGSIQHIQGIPEEIKPLYKTVWEISQKKIIEMAADRGPFIDQSQSLNLHIAQPNYGKITSMHFYSWKKGLKTGMYYLRTRPAADPIQFTIDKTSVRALMEQGVRGQAQKNGDVGHVIDPVEEAEEEVRILREIQRRNAEAISCSLDNPEGCLSCQG